VAGARAASVTIQRSSVILTGVQLSRTAVGAKGRASRTGARFQLSAPATVSAAIVDGSGRVVRTLATRRMRAGTNALAWDGRRSDGDPATDGEYSLVVAATNGGRPTDSMRVPVRVDRSTPTLRSTMRTKAGLDTAARVRFPLTVAASEDGTLELRYGRRAYRMPVKAGTRRIVVDGARLGLRAGTRGRTVRIVVRLTDGAGNVTLNRPRVAIPSRSRASRSPRTPAPTPTPPTTAPPAPTEDGGGGTSPGATGSWPWPLAGVVTSEFGLRWGRLHQGIDIAAPTGTPIHPAAPGTVTFVGQLDGYGNLVIVTHDGGIRTYYAHMSRFGGFEVGSSVTHLDTIGEVGCTGSCTGPHLHFETRVADTPRNPRTFLTARS
jgi:murein DD-endopeptidase MepM/ murein hydrolase activator NlpD